MPCQSGRSLAGAVIALAGAAIPALCGAQAVSWAHQNGSLQSNGSLTIKSQSGGSYTGQVNPAGAVAKTNQSAVTQPPTVIIQATAGSYSETVPKIIVGTTTAPTCPAGYTRIFAATGSDCPDSSNQVFNAAGTRWNLVSNQPNWAGRMGWIMDGSGYYYASSGGNYSVIGPQASCSGQSWAASICSK